MREFIAVIEFDEDIASKYNEVNGHGDPAPGEMLEQEFGWLEQSGISLKEWALTDFDVQWEQYIKYLVEWAIDHSSPDYEGETPASYDEWCNR